MISPPFLSLVIPAHNEANRITQTLQTVGEYLKAQSFSSEVLVVDDGSQDETAQIVESHTLFFEERGLSLRLLSNPGNQGKGYSIRHGFLESRGEIVLFSDADLSAPITESSKLIQPIVSGECDVAFGSRALAESLIGKHQSWIREAAGRSFNFFMRFTTGLPFSDTQCGFKAFRRLLLRPVFEQQRIFGFGFDVEILFLASKLGAQLCEIPIIWNDVEGSKVSMFRGLRAFTDLLVIRLRYACGTYHINSSLAPSESCESTKKSVA